MADASVSLDLDAQQLYQELQNVQSHFAQFASKATQEGEKAASGFTGAIKGGFGSIGGVLSSLPFAGALAGIFSVAGIEHAIASTVEYGTKVEDLSRRFGVASSTIQRFGNAAELNGSSLEAVARGFRFLEVNQAKALGGSEAMTKAFSELGISTEDLRSLRPEEIAEKIGHSSLNAADFVKVFGKSAIELRPLLAGLADGTIQFGSAISDLDTERLKEFDDLFKKIGQEAKILTATVLAELLPAIGALQGIAAKPAEAITRALDTTPTGAAAAPEDSALAAQIHAAREAAAGGPLPPELAPQGEAAKPRRDFSEPPGAGEAGESDDEGRATKVKESSDLDVIGADREAKKDEEKEERDAAREKKDAEREQTRLVKERIREQQTAERRTEHDEARALNPAGLSLHDIASANIIGSTATAQAREAEREEKIAKQRQLAGDLPGAEQHHNRAEELKKALGLPNDIDKEKHFQDALDKSEVLKAIRDNTAESGANK